MRVCFGVVGEGSFRRLAVTHHRGATFNAVYSLGFCHVKGFTAHEKTSQGKILLDGASVSLYRG